MYYSYVEIEYVATSFSPTRTDLAVKLLTNADDLAKKKIFTELNNFFSFIYYSIDSSAMKTMD